MTALHDLSTRMDVGAGWAKQDEGDVASVRIDALRTGFSPRIEGENQDHIQNLSEVDIQLPPILVHRPSMRIIDGMHRLHAAILRGMDTILVEFFDGTEDDAFLLALRRNATHGYPLTSADRKTAVRRVLDAHPEWSDRAVAEATGISSKTVGTIRRRVAGEDAGMEFRLGRDGRVRPLDPADGRLRACRLIEQNPSAPLREVASKSGISLSTAQDVRQRLRNGEDPLPSRQRKAGGATTPRLRNESAVRGRSPVDRADLVASLKKDPSLRLSEAGRRLLRLLDATELCRTDQWERLAETIPEHWLDAIAVLADEYAACWQVMAKQLQLRLEM